MKTFSNNPWKKIKEEIVYDNSWIQVTNAEVITPAGEEGIYGSVHFKTWAIGIIPHDEKCELIKTLSNDCTVMSEVGSKDSGILISPAKWIRMMQSELQAGSWKVIAEGRESGNVGVFRPNGTAHTLLINRIIAKIKPTDILWEAPQKNQQVWFIKLFGAEVNLGNIAPKDMIPLECLRLGLRGDTFFEFLPKTFEERLKQVNDDEEIDDADE